MFNKLSKNPFFLYLPFLIYYGYQILRFRYPELYGDEFRYLHFAQNLLHGFYSSPAPNINLWSGPGYPIFLMPFVYLKVPFIYIPLSNAVLLYLSIIWLYKALKIIAGQQSALIFATLWALNVNMWENLVSIFSEVFTCTLLSLLIYAITLFYTKKQKRYLFLSGLTLGVLTLTKVLFGYVLLPCLGLCLISLLIKQLKIFAKPSLIILGLAFVVVSPYLLYTYSITHKIFYWGNSGGMSLYWMSTPYDDEYGDWKGDYLLNATFPAAYGTAEGDSLLRKNHIKDIQAINKYIGVKRDSMYKVIALQNIKTHPKKFIRNYAYNFSRLLFGFPYSYYYHISSGIRNILMGCIYLWVIVVGVIITILKRRQLIYPVICAMLIAAVYLFLSGLLSAYPRMFDVIVPLLIFWFAFVIKDIRFTIDDKANEPL